MALVAPQPATGHLMGLGKRTSEKSLLLRSSEAAASEGVPVYSIQLRAGPHFQFFQAVLQP